MIDKNLHKIFKAAVKKRWPVQAWYVFGDNVVRAELRMDVVRGDRQELVLSPVPGSLPYLLQIISGVWKINIYIPDCSLIFTSDFKSIDEDGILTIGYPINHARYERREDVRVDPSSSVNVSFEMEGVKIRKECLDIGRGGLSVVFSRMERYDFENTKTIHKLRIEFEGHLCVELKATVAGKIKLKPHIFENCPYGGIRVSFKFVEIDDQQLKWLQFYVNKYDELAAIHAFS